MTKPSVDEVMRLHDEAASGITSDKAHALRAALESAIRSLVERPVSDEVEAMIHTLHRHLDDKVVARRAEAMLRSLSVDAIQKDAALRAALGLIAPIASEERDEKRRDGMAIAIETQILKALK